MSEAMAPVCFGAVTFYSCDSENCRSCGSFSSCSVKVQENIAEISKVMDVSTIMTRHREFFKKTKPLDKDSGRLKTQAPALERNVRFAPVPVVTPEQANALNDARKQLTKSILLPLLDGRPIHQLRQDLTNGVNPFTRAKPEQWLLCELLLRGEQTRANIEANVEKVGGKDRAKAVVGTLLAAGIAKDDQGKISVNKI